MFSTILPSSGSCQDSVSLEALSSLFSMKRYVGVGSVFVEEFILTPCYIQRVMVPKIIEDIFYQAVDILFTYYPTTPVHVH